MTEKLRPLRFCACLHTFNAALGLMSRGWRSPWWIGWLVLAVGFFLYDTPQRGESSWGSGEGRVSVALMALGVAALIWTAIPMR